MINFNFLNEGSEEIEGDFDIENFEPQYDAKSVFFDSLPEVSIEEFKEEIEDLMYLEFRSKTLNIEQKKQVLSVLDKEVIKSENNSLEKQIKEITKNCALEILELNSTT